MLMRENSVDFCYSDDDDANDGISHSTDGSHHVERKIGDVKNAALFSAGDTDTFSTHAFVPPTVFQKSTNEMLADAGRARRVLACSDDVDNSSSRVEHQRADNAADKYTYGLDGSGDYFSLSDNDEDQHHLVMERILADQGEAEGILTRHREGLSESEPTPRAWLHTTPIPPPFVSPVRAQQLEDAMNSAIEHVERTLIEFEQ